MEIAKKARTAALSLAHLPLNVRNECLAKLKSELLNSKALILTANQEDVAACPVDQPALLQRLRLTEAKFDTILCGIEDVIRLPDPLNRRTLHRELNPGLILQRVSCPIGVILMIYEARPDAGVQIASLALKSGNSLILKGGKEAAKTNWAIYKVLKAAFENSTDIPIDAVQQIESRELVQSLLGYHDLIDLVIPRGSNQLVRKIKESTRIVVLSHADGICMTYVDNHLENLSRAVEIIIDAKSNYPAACNALEVLLISGKIVPKISAACLQAGIKIRVDPGCELSRSLVDQAICELGKDAADLVHEFLELRMSLKIVEDVDEAINFINEFGSKHTDVIISDDSEAIAKFQARVDSAGVYSNCSSRFADGFRYGFGAEVGVSTNKIHARGPVGLEGLVLYKYL